MLKLQTLLGLFAGTMTTVSFIPQVWKLWQSKRAQDISLEMYLVFSVGVVFWLIYGILLKDFPIIIANSITLLLCLAVLGMKVRFR